MFFVLGMLNQVLTMEIERDVEEALYYASEGFDLLGSDQVSLSSILV